MSSESSPAGPSERAKTVFREFLGRRRDDEESAFDELCEREPELAEDLRGLHASWSAAPSTTGLRGGAALSQRLRDELGLPADAGIDLVGGERPGEVADSRYSSMAPIDRGGMGEVLRVWDGDLRRAVAMKLLREDLRPAAPSGTPTDLVRFIEEAQITGQLQHPGVVPVHELGLDERGRAYFTMRAVEGSTLGAIFELARDGREGWTLPRVVGVVQKVCETMAYAHSRGVIHRDLKPANVMVGRFGVTYVIDWGLAKLFARSDEDEVRTARAALEEARPGSALTTGHGAVLGTPCYMSPEQAGGRIEEIGPGSDVYSAGAILYEVLAGAAPYLGPDGRATPQQVLLAIQQGPPPAVHELRPEAPAELAAICAKAMAREPSARYASMEAMAEDVRAWLEGRVVAAYEAGALAELRKWVARNRATSAALAALLLAVVLGLAFTAWRETRSKRAILRGSDTTRLDDLVAEADTLWPPRAERVPALEEWLRRAEGLAGRLPSHRAELDRLRGRALATDPFVFESPEDRWRHDTLTELVARLEDLARAEDGLLDDVRRRIELAGRIRAETVDAFEERWATARREILDSPFYSDLDLPPQVGLVPLGEDAFSGLQEFAVWQSGRLPDRGDDGELVLDERSALVLVLLPGGPFTMGAWEASLERLVGEPNVDEDALWTEEPPHEVVLEPFFLSKFEMTQGQWLRCAGENPSQWGPGVEYGRVLHDLRHPVEFVTWTACAATVRRLGLELPTEAQWEYGARAGTDSPWSCGYDMASLDGYANVVDRAAADFKELEPHWRVFPELDDGYALHAPVGTFEPNDFGLYDVHGNVFEWCRDTAPGYEVPWREGDGYRAAEDREKRAIRGGSWNRNPKLARSTYRGTEQIDNALDFVGLRPSRAIER